MEAEIMSETNRFLAEKLERYHACLAEVIADLGSQKLVARIEKSYSERHGLNGTGKEQIDFAHAPAVWGNKASAPGERASSSSL